MRLTSRAHEWSLSVLRLGVVGAVGVVSLVACSGDDSSDGGRASSSASSPTDPSGDGNSTTTSPTGSSADLPATTTPASVLPPEPTGVPGLDDADAFCAAWVRYTASVQSVAIAGAFGGLDSFGLSRLEVAAAGVVVASVDSIAANWPASLADEAAVVIDELIGPFARRADRALEALTAAGASDAQVAALADAWLAALRARDSANPVVELSLDGDLTALVDTAAAAFDAAVTPFPEDPSLNTVKAVTPLTDAYLAKQCPALADQGIGDAV